MEKLKWNNIYETGIDVIDFQHKILIERINDLIELLNKNETQENLFPLFIFLEDYTNYHFDTEEQFFNSFNYTEKEKHLEEHEEFKEKIKNLKLKYNEDLEKIDDNLLDFLIDWLTNHIVGTDMEFANGLKKHMIF